MRGAISRFKFYAPVALLGLLLQFSVGVVPARAAGVQYCMGGVLPTGQCIDPVKPSPDGRYRPTAAQYLARSAQWWASASASCKNGYAPDYSEVCGYVSAMSVFCAQRDPADPWRPTCQAWGLWKPPVLPAFVEAVVQNWEGVKKCKVFYDALAMGPVSAGTPKVASSQRAKPEQIVKAANKYETLAQATKSSDAKGKVERLRKAYEVYEAVDDAKEKVEKAVSFVEMVQKVTPNRLLSMASIGIAQPELLACGLDASAPGYGACYEAAINKTGAAVAAAKAFQDYMQATDVVQCLVASDAVFSALGR